MADRNIYGLSLLDELKQIGELQRGAEITPKIYPYKGRKLMWNIGVYEEWFKYAKLAAKTPKAFSQIHNFNDFDDWWDNNPRVRNLFAEPLKELAVQVTELSGSHLTLKINLGYDAHRLREKVLNLLSQYSDNENTGSQAKFQPSKATRNIKVEKLAAPRKTFKLREQGLTNLEIAKELGLIDDDNYQYQLLARGESNQHKGAKNPNANLYEYQISAANRKIARDLRQYKKILEHVERGTFP